MSVSSYTIDFPVRPRWREDAEQLDQEMARTSEELGYLIAEHEAAGTNIEEDSRYLLANLRARRLIHEADEMEAFLNG